ncbi:MAG: Mut7-C RNAse domain-containing protein [Promethearchaeota archaeon]
MPQIWAQHPSFILDAMLGSLARWLRLLGFDTLYIDDKADKDILAMIGKRILLTRDKQLLLRAHKQGLKIINPGTPPISSMLQRLQEELQITYNLDPTQSRCSLCNSLLKPVKPEEVQDRVPKGSLSRHDQFWECTNPKCQQVFWQGHHWKRIQQTLKEVQTSHQK